MKKEIKWVVVHIPRGICALLFYVFGNTIGRLAYRWQYLRGKWFESWYSPGWEWVFRCFWTQKLLRINGGFPWPVGSHMVVSNWRNITFHPDDLNNFMGWGCYFQCFAGKITIGRGTYIAANTGLITANHDPSDLDAHLPGKDIILGERCWIGMNSVILPGVTLGENTVVGAGSVVTKSFPEGHCVIAGNPAKKIRSL